ncbi:MAG: cobalamin biosynthesis protein CobW [Hyphomicrobiaceae bacterium]
MIPAKVPCTIVTGFLGAGKTTLVRHLLETVSGRRLAVIVNEFGDVGIDGEILKGCGVASCPEENVVELANGCICCTVADDFVPTLETLLGRTEPPEHILIETSGLALPKPLVKAFDWPAIRSRVTVDAVVAVVDGRAVADGRFADDLEALDRQRAEDPSLDHDNPLEEVFEDQILCADLVVLNKSDLLDPAARQSALQGIRAAARPAVRIVETTQGALDPAVLIGLGAAAEDDLAARPSHHDGEAEHDHDDFDTFVVTVPEAASPEELQRRLAAVAEVHDVLRMKGYLRVAGKPMRLLVQAVGPRVQHHYDRPWRADEPVAGRLVVIGEKGLDRSAIERDLAG